jgi:Tol biopolymer transport system component
VSLPTWSPDGTQIVYYGRRWPAPTGHRNPNSILQAYCTMNADGSSPKPLAHTVCDSNCQDPPGQIDWLQANKILYLVDGGPIYSLAPGGKPKTLTTINAESFAVNAQKTRIASGANFGGCVTCSGPVAVTSIATGHRVGSVGGNKYDNMNPSLSPNGKQVVFERDPDTDTGKALGLWTANASGTHVRQLLKTGYQPLWSPAGDEIAYRTGTGKTAALHVIPVTGGKSRVLVSKNAVNVFDWSPDGTSIAFESGSTLSIVDVQTGKVTALQPLKYQPTAAWSADSSKLVANTVTKLSSKGIPQCWATWVVPADGSTPTKISSCS